MNFLEQLYLDIDQKELWRSDINLKRGQFLMTATEIDQSIYFVTEGCLRIYLVDEHEEHTVRFAYQANFFMAMDSYITGEATNFHMEALRKTTVKRVTKNDFESLFINSTEKLMAWNQALHHLVYQQLEREQDILTSSPKQRYERVLKRSPQLFQEVPQKYIASYLRMSPETLSRLQNS